MIYPETNNEVTMSEYYFFAPALSDQSRDNISPW